MKTDTIQKGLERLIYTVLTGRPCEPVPEQATVGSEPSASYGGSGWIGGFRQDYNRE